MRDYDFVVIGSGIAGLTFALKAAKHGSVAVVTKRKGSDTNTARAQGGIACVTSDEDSFELHVRDTLEAGAGLCDEAVVRTIVTEGPDRIRELIALGLQFDEREVSGHRELDLGKEGGHSKRRVLHVRDVTGKEVEETLLRELDRQSRVTWTQLIAAAENDFEAPVFAAYGKLREIKRSLQALGAEIALLSGSGATVFGVFGDEARARLAQAQFASENLMNVFVAPTCSGPLGWRYELPR